MESSLPPLPSVQSPTSTQASLSLPKESTPRSRWRRFFVGGLIATAVLLLMAGLVAGGWYLSVTRGTLEPTSATPTDLVAWYLLRDLTRESLDVRRALADRFEQTFGVDSRHRPQFSFSPTVRDTLHRVHSGSPDARTVRNSETLLAAALLRDCRDYHDLKKSGARIQVQLTAAAKTAERLQWWQTVQIDYCRAIDVTPPTQAELLASLERIFAVMMDASPADEAAAIRQYKRVLLAAMVFGPK